MPSATKTDPLAEFGFKEFDPFAEFQEEIVNEQHPDISAPTRGRIHGLGTPEGGAELLREQGFEVEHQGGFSYLVRKPGEKKWHKLEREGGWPELSDAMDIVPDAIDTVAGIFGGGAGGAAGLSAGGPVGAVAGSAAGFGGGMAASQAARQGLGKLFGMPQTAGDIAGEAALTGTVGAVADVAFKGLGHIAKGAARKYFAKEAQGAATAAAGRAAGAKAVQSPTQKALPTTVTRPNPERQGAIESIAKLTAQQERLAGTKIATPQSVLEKVARDAPEEVIEVEFTAGATDFAKEAGEAAYARTVRGSLGAPFGSSAEMRAALDSMRGAALDKRAAAVQFAKRGKPAGHPDYRPPESWTPPKSFKGEDGKAVAWATAEDSEKRYWLWKTQGGDKIDRALRTKDMKPHEIRIWTEGGGFRTINKSTIQKITRGGKTHDFTRAPTAEPRYAAISQHIAKQKERLAGQSAEFVEEFATPSPGIPYMPSPPISQAPKASLIRKTGRVLRGAGELIQPSRYAGKAIRAAGRMFRGERRAPDQSGSVSGGGLGLGRLLGAGGASMATGLPFLGAEIAGRGISAVGRLMMRDPRSWALKMLRSSNRKVSKEMKAFARFILQADQQTARTALSIILSREGQAEVAGRMSLEEVSRKVLGISG